MKKLGFLFALLIFSVGGCSSHKELTASSAKDMLQERLDQEPNRANIPLDPFTKDLFKTTPIDYRASPTSGDNLPGIIHRLIDAGFATQQTFGREYVDFSGLYKGEIAYPAVTHHFEMSLTMKPGSAQIKGEVVRTINDNRAVASISRGNALPDGSISLTFIVGSYNNGVPIYTGPLTYKLSTANGQAILNGPVPFQWDRVISYVKSEQLSSSKITVPMYSYALTPKVAVKVVNGSDQVSLGKIVVTNVDALLLATDTVATANFKWRIDLSRIGDVITESKSPERLGEVKFGKQPDGTWVITGINM